MGMAPEIIRKGAAMKRTVLALSNQLKNFPDLSYASLSAYVAADPYQLMEKDKFPFFNIVPGDLRIERGPDKTSQKEFIRYILPVAIQFATSSMELNIAVMGDDNSETFRVGLLDFAEDIWNGVIFDETLGGAVDGILPKDTAIPMDYIARDDLMFIARAEFKIEFYRDKGLL
jgi:hypothetical protein